MDEIYEALKAAIEREEAVALATLVAGESIGAKLLVYSDGRRLGSLGEPTLDDLVARDVLELLPQGRAETRGYTLPGGRPLEIYLESYLPQRRLVIVGAVHTAIPLVSFARELGYHTTVVDARGFFATRERFPHADELIVGWPDEVLERLPLGLQTDLVILSHDPKFEDPTLAVALRRPLGYIGAMGSRKTSAERNQRLRQAGFSDEQIARIHAPIGLEIGARTPAEVAIAILAEIIAVRSGRDPRRLAAPGAARPPSAGTT